jgi:hypothetical protein
MGIKFANNAWGVLASPLAAGDGTVTLSAGHGSRFPALSASDYFYGTLIDTANNLEVVKVTARATDTMTMTRAQDGTAARSYAVGDRLEMRLPAIALNEVVNVAQVAASLIVGNSYTAALFRSTGSTAGFQFADRLTPANEWLWYGGSNVAYLYAAFGTVGNKIQIDNAGNLTATGDVTGFSDARFKENWRALGEHFIEGLAGVLSGIYDRTDQAITQVGVSAQSLRKVMPHAVLEDPANGRLSVAYGNAALVACVELARAVVQLTGRVKALETKEV